MNLKRRFLGLFLVTMLLTTMFQPAIDANSSVLRVYVDGKELLTDQPPITQNGRVLVPFRAIFEKLNAQVQWHSKSKKVTAVKGNRTIVLQMGSKKAWINNQAVYLDVEPKIINGRTLVPGRFVSESFGAQVYYDASSKKVFIYSKKLEPVRNLQARDVADHGDGRDMEISFSPSSDESDVSHYRIMLVRSELANSFGLAEAKSVPITNYTIVYKTGSNIRLNLASSVKDVEGVPIQENISYRAYVLTVPNSSSSAESVLSAPSYAVTLTQTSVQPATNVIVNDLSDYGNGRDIKVSFYKAYDENNLNHYRVMFVRAENAPYFDLSTANTVPSQHYTVVNPTGSNLAVNMQATTKDVHGNNLQSGVSYRAFILSVGDSSRGIANALSAPSAAFNLTNNLPVPAATSVAASDEGNFEDGRDMGVSFSKASPESNIHHYRVMVVRSESAPQFDLAAANSVASSNYVNVKKTGRNQEITLPSTAKDTSGNPIKSGVSYRVFILAVADHTKGYSNSLSQPSAPITLSNPLAAEAVTNVVASDVNNYGDGRDMRVTFKKASEERNILNYRVMVVKEANANHFTLESANNVPANHYTQVDKTGNDLSVTLGSATKDVNGELIRSGVSYRVFVLSVSIPGGRWNSLSLASPAIVLSNTAVQGISNLEVNDISNYGDGRDLEVSFTRATEEHKISGYGIMVVKAENTDTFDLTTANNVPSSNYTLLQKTGTNYKVALASGAKDVDGEPIQADVPYKVFILSIADGVNATNNILSSPSREISLVDKKLDWSGDTFTESILNDGSFISSIDILLSGDGFVSGTFREGTHYVVGNLPQGLTVSITKISNTHLRVSLSGKAQQHQQENSISNLSLAFTNAAFAGGNASAISETTKSNLKISFKN